MLRTRHRYGERRGIKPYLRLARVPQTPAVSGGCGVHPNGGWRRDIYEHGNPDVANTNEHDVSSRPGTCDGPKLVERETRVYWLSLIGRRALPAGCEEGQSQRQSFVRLMGEGTTCTRQDVMGTATLEPVWPRVREDGRCGRLENGRRGLGIGRCGLEQPRPRRHLP